MDVYVMVNRVSVVTCLNSKGGTDMCLCVERGIFLDPFQHVLQIHCARFFSPSVTK
jgi:hypothetical protein